MHNHDTFMELEITGDDKAFVAGQPIQGNVHVHAKDSIKNVSQISLTLNGEEQVVLHLPDKKAGGAVKPVSKIHPIINEKFTVVDYAAFQNKITGGCYTFPFTFYLPEWIPQSHLCFNQPEAKKPNILNTFKIRYNLIACIESNIPDPEDPSATTIVECEKVGCTGKIEMQKMLQVKRITVVTPEFSEPLLNQEVGMSAKIR